MIRIVIRLSMVIATCSILLLGVSRQQNVQPKYWIVYSDATPAGTFVYLVSWDGQEKHEITEGRLVGAARDQSWLVIQKGETERGYVQNAQLYRVNLVGNQLQSLSNNEFTNRFVTVSGDDHYIFYTVEDGVEMQAEALYRVDVVTGQSEVLDFIYPSTNSIGWYRILWSPDGRWQFHQIRLEIGDSTYLYHPGGEVERFEHNFVTWLEGTRFLYRDAEGRNFIEDVENGEVLPVSDCGGQPFTLSPDEAWLYCVTLPERAFFHIPVQGGEGEILGQLDGYDVGSANWSPDGEWLIFSTWDLDESFNAVYTFRPSTGSLIPLWSYDRMSAIRFAGWSPDSLWLGLIVNNYSLIRLQPDGNRQEILLDEARFIRTVSQTPDGEEILLVSGDTIYRLNLSRGELQPITRASSEDMLYSEVILIAQGGEQS